MKPRKDRQIGKLGQDNKDRIAGTGQPRQDRQDKTTGWDSRGSIVFTGQPRQEIRDLNVLSSENKQGS
jgi:hypothetical protein